LTVLSSLWSEQPELTFWRAGVDVGLAVLLALAANVLLVVLPPDFAVVEFLAGPT
jgi:hypothetical protein